jgi:Flp pilus assembly protein TadD
MRIVSAVAAVACLVALAGCSSSGKFAGLGWGEDSPPPANETTSGIGGVPPEGNLTVKDALLGGDPSDDLSLGKRHYREQNYGLAEQHFRRAVEKLPRDGEAWLGLAASYDRLRRYELADRAYRETLSIYGRARGAQQYGLLVPAARRSAQGAAEVRRSAGEGSGEPTIANNIALVDAAAKRRKGLN